MLNHFSSRLLYFGLVLILFVIPLQAQEPAGVKATEHRSEHIMLVPTDLAWKEGPASLPKGVKSAVLEGDPTKPGPFTMHLKLPANYKVPPHWHPAIEHVTVISGSFHMGLGEVFDESKAKKLPVGGFAVMAIGTRHFAFTTEEATIQLHGIGPWGITYVKATDDPRNKAADK